MNSNKKNYSFKIKEINYENNLNINFIKFGFFIGLFIIAILIAMLPFIMKQKKLVINHRTLRYQSDLKYILFWDQPKIKTLKSLKVKYVPEFEVGQNMFIKQKCPYYNCYIAYNESVLRDDISNFDAIVFDVHGVSKFSVNEFNLKRSPYQKFIFRAHDSSEKHPVCNPVFEDFFNWTWTYKLNSDIPHPFMTIHDQDNNLVGPKINMNWTEKMNHSKLLDKKYFNKNKAVAWLVTKCKLKNKYQDFVNDLKKELNGYNYTVDLFGPCGEKKCPGGQLQACLKIIERDYFFQMVLEESSTEDYVTNKIVKVANTFVLPLVNGAANYTRFLSPGSYVNAHDFDMKKLGALINYLVKNPNIYEYFFDWKQYYSYTPKHKSYVCDLCKKLNEQDEWNRYENFRTWWNPNYKDICQRMYLYEMFN